MYYVRSKRPRTVSQSGCLYRAQARSQGLSLPGNEVVPRQGLFYAPVYFEVIPHSGDTAVGSVSSRECLDAPAILATFTAGRTGLVACS